MIEHPGVLTGSLKFSIELSAVDGEMANFGGITSTSFEIKDNDVVVDWDFLVGEWKATDDGSSFYKNPVVITKESDTTLKLKNLWDEGYTIVGTVEFDKAANTATLVFKGGQVVYESGTYGPCGAYSVSGNSLIDLQASVTGSGITIGPWYVIILTGQYAGYNFSGSGGGYGGVTTLTK